MGEQQQSVTQENLLESSQAVIKRKEINIFENTKLSKEAIEKLRSKKAKRQERKRTGLEEEQDDKEEEEKPYVEELDIKSGAAYNLGHQHFKNYYDKKSTVKVLNEQRQMR